MLFCPIPHAALSPRASPACHRQRAPSAPQSTPLPPRSRLPRKPFHPWRLSRDLRGQFLRRNRASPVCPSIYGVVAASAPAINSIAPAIPPPQGSPWSIFTEKTPLHLAASPTARPQELRVGVQIPSPWRLPKAKLLLLLLQLRRASSALPAAARSFDCANPAPSNPASDALPPELLGRSANRASPSRPSIHGVATVRSSSTKISPSAPHRCRHSPILEILFCWPGGLFYFLISSRGF